MDFDILSFIFGAVAGFGTAAIIGRSKFREVQDELRDARADLAARIRRARTKS